MASTQPKTQSQELEEVLQEKEMLEGEMEIVKAARCSGEVCQELIDYMEKQADDEGFAVGGAEVNQWAKSASSGGGCIIL
jgi:hypothetical protein